MLAAGRSPAEAAAAVGVSTATVQRFRRRAQAAGVQ
jgi:hypothetical protein